MVYAANLRDTASLPAILLILLVDKRIRHPRNVIANDARQWLLPGFFTVGARQVVGLLHPVSKELSGDALGVFLLSSQRRTVVKILVEKGLEAAALLFDKRTECGKPPAPAADIFQRMHPRSLYTLRRVRNQVPDKPVKNAFQRLVEHQLLGHLRIAAFCLVVMAFEKVHIVGNLLDRQQSCFVAIV